MVGRYRGQYGVIVGDAEGCSVGALVGDAEGVAVGDAEGCFS